MAKDDIGRIRLVVVELEGNNQTLQDGMRTIATALSRPSIPRVIQSATPNGGNGQGGEVNIQPTLEFATEVPTDEFGTAPATRRTAKAHRKYPTPKVVDIDLDEGKVPFESFCSQKNPKTTQDKYLVVASWLKDYRSIETVNDDHFYTCFKRMGWGVQSDMSKPLRNAKSAGLMNSSGLGQYSINHLGEDRVRKMG